MGKKANNGAYASTFLVKQGEMLVVMNTDANTSFYTVVILVAKASLEERSHF